MFYVRQEMHEDTTSLQDFLVMVIKITIKN